MRLPITSVSNHNGEINNEVRLIYVVQRGTGMPIYMRYIPGNVVNVSTLLTTIAELKALKVDTKFAILDAGYLTLESMGIFLDQKISFLARVKKSWSFYKEIVKKQLVSSRRVSVKDLLPLYYTRQDIEQVFDISKGYAKALPLCVQTVDTFRGHLLMVFCSTIVLRHLQQLLRRSPYSLDDFLSVMRNQKAKIYEDVVVPMESTKKQNDFYKLAPDQIERQLATSVCRLIWMQYFGHETLTDSVALKTSRELRLKT